MERDRDKDGLIPAHGGYQQLKSYQMAEIVYDATVVFCERFIDKYSRTRDQMVQAARSGKQNIAEGSMVSGTSRKMELKLIGVARASLEELLMDYQDYLRQHSLALWDKNHPKAVEVRKLAYVPDRSYLTYRTYIENAPPEVAANAIICVIHQTNYLLDRQLKQLEKQFLAEGGFTERLYHERIKARRQRGGNEDGRDMVDKPLGEAVQPGRSPVLPGEPSAQDRLDQAVKIRKRIRPTEGERLEENRPRYPS